MTPIGKGVGRLLLAFSVLVSFAVAQDSTVNHPTTTDTQTANPSAPATGTPTTGSPSAQSADTGTANAGTANTSTSTQVDQTTPPTAGASNATTNATVDQSSTNASPDGAVPGANPAEHVKTGSKNDIDSIGNRNVGGRGLGDWYSTESEISMGKRYAQEVEQTVRLIQDPIITEYVNRIGQNIVRNSDAKVPFTIKVVDSDEVNAFALPGGFFYVNSGLILTADNEAELAGVMSHEIAHVCARHAMRQLTRAQWANIGSIPLIFVGGGLGYALSGIANLALPLTFLHFSRGFESEADYLGVQYMYKAGYDPQSFIDFFEKLQAQEKKKPGTLAKAFSTHPQTPDRISKSQAEIANILPARPQYVVTTSEFDDVKARLASIENRHKLVDRTKDTKKPTLRRTTTADNKNDKGDKGDNKDDKDDDRPTLQRRDQ